MLCRRLILLKRILAQSANRTYPIFRNIFKGGSGSDAAVGISDFGIVHIAAGANIFLHFFTSFFVLLTHYFRDDLHYFIVTSAASG